MPGGSVVVWIHIPQQFQSTQTVQHLVPHGKIPHCNQHVLKLADGLLQNLQQVHKDSLDTQLHTQPQTNQIWFVDVKKWGHSPMIQTLKLVLAFSAVGGRTSNIRRLVDGPLLTRIGVSFIVAMVRTFILLLYEYDKVTRACAHCVSVL